jgi:hypothetical protein
MGTHLLCFIVVERLAETKRGTRETEIQATSYHTSCRDRKTKMTDSATLGNPASVCCLLATVPFACVRR